MTALTPAARAASIARLRSLLPSPDCPTLVVLIGSAGSGKSTVAGGWEPATQVVELDQLRAVVSDNAGDQSATGAAVAVQSAILEARLGRGLACVVDSTNCEERVRIELVQVARRHRALPVALVMVTPLEVCLERNASRPALRRVPEPVVRTQHAAATAARKRLHEEGFDLVITGPDWQVSPRPQRSGRRGS